MSSYIINLPLGWEKLFIDNKTELDEIILVLYRRLKLGITLQPSFDLIMKPFYDIPLHRLRVVIVGKEPYRYHSDGLAFSSKAMKTPSTLSIIFQELEREGYTRTNKTNSLEHWSHQGILLLNAYLTIEVDGKNKRSHEMLWKAFIREVIRYCSKRGDVIFVLWGHLAHSFESYIDHESNAVFKADYPSNEENNDFLGCNHFKLINEFLSLKNEKPIQWI